MVLRCVAERRLAQMHPAYSISMIDRTTKSLLATQSRARQEDAELSTAVAFRRHKARLLPLRVCGGVR